MRTDIKYNNKREWSFEGALDETEKANGVRTILLINLVAEITRAGF